MRLQSRACVGETITAGFRTEYRRGKRPFVGGELSGVFQRLTEHFAKCELSSYTRVSPLTMPNGLAWIA